MFYWQDQVILPWDIMKSSAKYGVVHMMILAKITQRCYYTTNKVDGIYNRTHNSRKQQFESFSGSLFCYIRL